jgi:hypothetical protein
MLIPIKIFTVPTRRIPSLSDLEEAKQLCITEDCTVELRWCPNIYAGWYHLYITAEDDVYKMYETQVPKCYGV